MVAEFFRRVQAVIWNRCLMRTRGGHLGIVRKDVRPGDSICIIHGCSVPVILREHQDHYGCKVLGECYVHSMMDGEAIVYQRDNDIKTTWIILR